MLTGYYITVAMFITVLSAGLTVMDSSSKRLHVSMETVVFQIPIMAVNVKKSTPSWPKLIISYLSLAWSATCIKIINLLTVWHHKKRACQWKIKEKLDYVFKNLLKPSRNPGYLESDWAVETTGCI